MNRDFGKLDLRRVYVSDLGVHASVLGGVHASVLGGVYVTVLAQLACLSVSAKEAYE